MMAWDPLDTVGVVALVPMLLLCITQWLRFDRSRVVAELQALTPHVLSLAVPLAMVAALKGNATLAALSLIPLATLLVLALPIVVRMDAPADAPTTLVLGCVNLLGVDNPTPPEAAAAIARHDADVWVLVEVTPTLATEIESAMGQPPLYRSEILDPGTNGIAVWSRWPIVSGGVVDEPGRRIVDVVIARAERSVRVMAVHTHPPTQGGSAWSKELHHIGKLAGDGHLSTVIAGDFNAARWHPSFRRLLRKGWIDSHELVGKGWGASWPADRGWLPPPFVRLDHALVRRPKTAKHGHGSHESLSPTSVTDFRVPGSDHTGFVVELAVTG